MYLAGSGSLLRAGGPIQIRNHHQVLQARRMGQTDELIRFAPSALSFVRQDVYCRFRQFAEGRRPDSYQPGATRQVQIRDNHQGL